MLRDKNRPDSVVESRALAARRNVLSIILFRFKPRGFINTGSGFVIKKTQRHGSLVLTSAHYLLGIKPKDQLLVRVTVQGRVQELAATLFHLNAAMDVSILRVPDLTSVPALRFAPSSLPGQCISAVGYVDPDKIFPKTTFAMIPICSPGHVSEYGTEKHEKTGGIRLYHVYLNCVTPHGMSGGPVLSKNGVIGMIDSGIHGISRAVAPRTLLQVVTRHFRLPPQDNWDTALNLIE